jgi:hypothetical protein
MSGEKRVESRERAQEEVAQWVEFRLVDSTVQ